MSFLAIPNDVTELKTNPPALPLIRGTFCLSLGAMKGTKAAEIDVQIYIYIRAERDRVHFLTKAQCDVFNRRRNEWRRGRERRSSIINEKPLRAPSSVQGRAGKQNVTSAHFLDQ